MKFWAVKRNGQLLPDSVESQTEFDKIPIEKHLQVEVRQPRNAKHARLYWKLCSRIGNGIGKDAEWVSNAFKIELGHVSIYRYGGKDHMVLGSVAFDKLDQIGFDAFWKNCLEIMYCVWKIEPESVADLVARDEVKDDR